MTYIKVSRYFCNLRLCHVNHVFVLVMLIIFYLFNIKTQSLECTVYNSILLLSSTHATVEVKQASDLILRAVPFQYIPQPTVTGKPFLKIKF